MPMDHGERFDDLPPKLVRVAGLLAAGLTYPQIAGVLCIEVSTVSSHVQRLRDLTDCGSRAGVAELWRAHRVAWLLRKAEHAGIDELELYELLRDRLEERLGARVQEIHQLMGMKLDGP